MSFDKEANVVFWCHIERNLSDQAMINLNGLTQTKFRVPYVIVTDVYLIVTLINHPRPKGDSSPQELRDRESMVIIERNIERSYIIHYMW